MNPQKLKARRAERRRYRVRKAIYGTPERPRLSVFRANLHIPAQLIDDLNGVTLASATSGGKNSGLKHGANIKAAAEVGKKLAEAARAKGITKAAFDRGHFRFHGRIAALAVAATEAGLVCTDPEAYKAKQAAAGAKAEAKPAKGEGKPKGEKGEGKPKGEKPEKDGEANEVPPAVEKAIKEGEGNVQRTRKISLRGNTIPHRIIGKYGASRVIMVPAGPGTGVKAGPGVREVLQACGITNILTKVHGSTNPLNLVKATIAGLLQLRTREEVARLRGVAV